MAPITWRNVGTPNFGDSVAALGMSGRFLDRAFSGAAEGLGAFDTWRTEQNDRTALDAASRIQDPTAYRAALENGTAMGGLPPAAVSSRILAALDARGSMLTDRASAEANRVFTQSNREAQAAAGPVQAAIQAAIARGDTAEAARLQQTNVDVLGRLTLADGQGVARGASDLQTAAVGRDATRAGTTLTGVQTDAARMRLTTEQETQRDQGQVNSVVAGISQSGVADTAGVQQYLDREIAAGRLSPRAYNAAVTQLAAAGYQGLSSAPGAASGAVGGTATPLPNPSPTGGATPPGTTVAPARIAGAVTPGAQSSAGATPAPAAVAAVAPPPTDRNGRTVVRPENMVVGNGTFGRPPRDLSTMTLAEVEDFGRTVLIPNSRGRIGHADPTLGSSAAGTYQITNDTRARVAPRVFGENWRSVPYTAENQDRLARAVYEDAQRSGQDITQVWTGLAGTNVPGTNVPSNRPGAYRNVSWEDARGLIAQRETGSGSGTPLAFGTPTQDRTYASGELSRAGEIQRDVDLRAAQLVAGTPAREFYALAADNRSPVRVATDLVAPNGALAGMPQTVVQDEINRLLAANNGAARNAGVSAAQIGQMITQNGRVTAATSGLFGIGASPASGAFNTRANDTALALLIDSTTNTNGMRGLAEQYAQDTSQSAALTQRREVVTNQISEVQRLETRLNENMGTPREQGAREALERAQNGLNRLRRELNTTVTRLSRPLNQAAQTRAAEIQQNATPVGARRGQAAAATPGTAGATLAQAVAPSAPTEGDRVTPSFITPTPEGPTRGAQVALARAAGAPPIEGAARPGTIPRAQRIDEENPTAGMFDPIARGGRQADETGVNQTRLGLALLAPVMGAAGAGRTAIAAAARPVTAGIATAEGVAAAAARELATRTASGIPAAAAAANAVRPGIQAAEGIAAAVAQRTATNAVTAGIEAAGGLPAAAAQAAARAATATQNTQIRGLLQSVVRQAENGVSMPEAIRIVAQQQGLRPEAVARIVREIRNAAP